MLKAAALMPSFRITDYFVADTVGGSFTLETSTLTVLLSVRPPLSVPVIVRSTVGSVSKSKR